MGCCSTALLQLTNSIALQCKTNSRNFVRADDARNGSEETATAFTVSKTSHNESTVGADALVEALKLYDMKLLQEATTCYQIDLAIKFTYSGK